MTIRFGLVALGSLGALAAACGGGDDDASRSKNALAFHGEVNPLGDYSYDSGMQPPASPVQAEFVFASEAKLAVDAKAVVTDDDALAGLPGSGNVGLHAKFLLQAKLHVDFSGLKYDGDVPGLDAIDIAFDGKQPFDPFALKEGITLDTSIPETPLPSIPLPGGLPGELALTITTGSVLSSTFQGTCAATDGKTASYRGESTTKGSVAIKPSIVLHVPLVGDKTFDLPVVTAPIPELHAAIDLGTEKVTGTADAPEGADTSTTKSCDAVDPGTSSSGGPGSSSGGASSGGNASSGGGPDLLDGGGGDAGTVLACADNSVTYEALTEQSPKSAVANPGSCTGAQLDAFSAALDAATGQTSDTLVASVDGACRSCIFTEITDGTLPDPAAAILYFAGGGIVPNYGWCVGNRVGSPTCGRAVEAFSYCGDAVCAGCGSVDPETGEGDAENQACVQAAYSAPYACDGAVRDGALADCPQDTLEDATTFCNQLSILQQIRVLCGPS